MSNEMDDALRAYRIMFALSEREHRAYKQNPMGHTVEVRLSHDDIFAITLALDEVIRKAGGIMAVGEERAREIDRILGRNTPLRCEQPLTGPGIYRPSRRAP